MIICHEQRTMIHSNLCPHSRQPEREGKHKEKKRENSFTNMQYSLLPPYISTCCSSAGKTLVHKQDTRMGKNSKTLHCGHKGKG